MKSRSDTVSCEKKKTTNQEYCIWQNHPSEMKETFEQAPGVGDGQGSLAWTWLSDWTKLNWGRETLRARFLDLPYKKSSKGIQAEMKGR